MASPVEAEFWRWFADHGDKIKAAKGFKANWLVKQVGKRFTTAFPKLVFQCGPRGDGIWTFEVSADGIEDQIPEVIRVVNAAPQIKGWEIVKFRQPTDVGSIQFGGFVLSASTIRYDGRLVEQKASINLYLPGYSRERHDQLIGACFILLDGLLGEYAVMKVIHDIEFKSIDQATSESKPLQNLRSDLEGLGLDLKAP